MRVHMHTHTRTYTDISKPFDNLIQTDRLWMFFLGLSGRTAVVGGFSHWFICCSKGVKF